MKPLAAYFVLVGLTLLLAALVLAVRTRKSGRVRLVAKPLMTQAERRALSLLEQALPDCRIHAQVAMGALLRPERGLSRRDHWHWRGRYSQKIVDFVVEDRVSGRLLALVELDDSSHDVARDAARDRLTAAAGYRTVRLATPSPSCIAREAAALRLAANTVPG